MKCDVCNSKNSYVKEYTHKYVIKGKSICFKANRRFCSKCNNLVFDDVLDNEASLLAIKLFNKEYGINKDKIIELRKNYNLSLELFSKVIGCAKKTLISYEKGTSIPNDNYLITLKSLIAKPETISILIEANKDMFSKEEYTKLEEKVLNNYEEDINLNHQELNEFNGYTKYDINKVYNMILYFAKNTVLKTKLLKEMFYADFLSYKELGKSITGLKYVKVDLGPVPDQYQKIIDSGTINKIIKNKHSFDNEYECYKISSLKETNESIFTNEEFNILKKVITHFKNFGSKSIADYSHKEKAFTNNKLYQYISYDYAFDLNDFNN